MMDEDATGFGDLLQQAEQLTADIDGSAELPRVRRNLKQILEESQQLWSRTSQLMSRDSSDVKASVLLGSKGFDLPKISQKLETLSATKTFEPIEPIEDTDIQGFIRNERENAILSVIEDSTKTTLQESDKFYWDFLLNEWQQKKRKILNSLLGSCEEVMDVTLTTEPSFRESIDMKTRSTMSTLEIAYALEMSQYNDIIIQGGTRYNLIERFYNKAKELDDKDAVDLWEMVSYMTEVPVQPGRDIHQIRTSIPMQSAFVRQARKYLEKNYLGYMKMIVYGNLSQATLGGVPGTLYLVRSYLNIRLPVSSREMEDGTVEGHPVWAVIYLCLRCGDITAAVQAAKLAGNAVGDIASYLMEYLQSEDKRLSPTNEGQVRLQYSRTVRTSTDPYKKAVYCILGCCDVVDDHCEVATKVEDYLWLRLCQIHFEDEGTDRINLPRLQTLLLEEHGEVHFNAYQQPFLYFQVLFLTAQFEAAIEFLSRLEALRCHAVHVAVVLYEMHLLILPASAHVSLLSRNPGDVSPTQRLNFARLIMMYTKKFEVSDPREALQYFYMLRDLKGIRGENLFMACISELVLETKEFEVLLGKMEKDSCRQVGAIDKFHGDTQKIIEVVAEDSENRGLYEEAVKLYDLAKKHDKAVSILNKLLSQVVPQVSSPGSTRERLENLSLDIAERYRNYSCNASKETIGTLHLLLDLLTFFNQYHSKQTALALETIQQLQLIPFQPEDVDQKVNAFAQYSEEVRRILPDVLLGTMNILFSQYKESKNAAGSPQGFPSRSHMSEGQEKYIRSQARALIMFAGTIPYRMPGDTNARLVQMEVLMT